MVVSLFSKQLPFWKREKGEGHRERKKDKEKRKRGGWDGMGWRREMEAGKGVGQGRVGEGKSGERRGGENK